MEINILQTHIAWMVRDGESDGIRVIFYSHLSGICHCCATHTKRVKWGKRMVEFHQMIFLLDSCLLFQVQSCVGPSQCTSVYGFDLITTLCGGLRGCTGYWCPVWSSGRGKKHHKLHACQYYWRYIAFHSIFLKPLPLLYFQICNVGTYLWWGTIIQSYNSRCKAVQYPCVE
jgi:hypothetical protein